MNYLDSQNYPGWAGCSIHCNQPAPDKCPVICSGSKHAPVC